MCLGIDMMSLELFILSLFLSSQSSFVCRLNFLFARWLHFVAQSVGRGRDYHSSQVAAPLTGRADATLTVARCEITAHSGIEGTTCDN